MLFGCWPFLLWWRGKGAKLEQSVHESCVRSAQILTMDGVTDSHIQHSINYFKTYLADNPVSPLREPVLAAIDKFREVAEAFATPEDPSLGGAVAS